VTLMAWGHLSEDILMDLLEGTADEGARQHMAACAECRARVEAAREGLGRSIEAEVPEPPPLYWEAFRRQIGRRLDGDEAAGHRLRLRWWPAAAAAALVVGALLVPRTTPVAPTLAGAPLPAWSPLPPADDDTGLGLLRALGPETADLGEAADCRDAADCVAGLSDEESQALAEALRAEIQGELL